MTTTTTDNLLSLPKNQLAAANAFIDDKGSMDNAPSASLAKAAAKALKWGDSDGSDLSPQQTEALSLVAAGLKIRGGRTARAARNGLSVALYGTKAR